jgi:hypothetical protein
MRHLQKQTIVFVAGILAIIILSALLAFFRTNRTSPFDSEQNASYPAVTTSRLDLEKQIEQWDLYQPAEDIAFGTGECLNMNSEFRSAVSMIQQEGAKRLLLNGALELVLTSNPRGWSNETFLAFHDDQSVICGAGGIYPLQVYDSRLLWKGTCSSGMEPEVGSPSRMIFEKCMIAENVVLEYFRE